MADTCRHGTWSSTGSHWIEGGTERAVERHEKSCRKARPFAHPGTLIGLMTVVCCATCRRRIA